MDTQTHDPTRPVRRPPGIPQCFDVPFVGAGKLCEEVSAGAIELTVHATNTDGQLADWFDDVWWTDLVERWSDREVTLRLSATSAALLHPMVLHELEMVSRIAPRWRLVGHAFRDDLGSDDDLETLARSPYHEIRFFDQDRPDAKRTLRCQIDRLLPELFGQIREEQARAGTRRPVLVRLPAKGTQRPTPLLSVDGPTTFKT